MSVDDIARIIRVTALVATLAEGRRLYLHLAVAHLMVSLSMTALAWMSDNLVSRGLCLAASVIVAVVAVLDLVQAERCDRELAEMQGER